MGHRVVIFKIVLTASFLPSKITTLCYAVVILALTSGLRYFPCECGDVFSQGVGRTISMDATAIIAQHLFLWVDGNDSGVARDCKSRPLW